MCSREMKNSGVQWIGKIPKEWSIAPLGQYLKERNEKVSDKDFEPLSVTKQGVMKQLENVAKTDNNDNRKKVCKGDFVINSRSDRKQSCGLSELDGSVSVINIVLKNIGIEEKYLKYVLKNYGFAEEFYRWGSGIVADLWSTKYEKMKRIMIPIPDNGAKVGDYLDKKVSQIDYIILKQRRLIEKYKAYKQSLITETVTKGLNKNVPMKNSGIEWIGEIPSHWSVCKMKNIGEAIIGLTYSPEEVSDKGTLVLRSSNVQNGKIVYEDNVFVNKDISERLMTRIGDILICSRNGSRALIGKCAYIDELSAGKSFGAFMTIFRSKYNKFIYYTLNSAIFKFHIGTFLTSTINQLTTSNLSSIRITLPPKEEQQEISDFLDKKCNSIDSVIAKKERLIEKLEDYKKSLIYECVTGKREVN